LGGDQKGFPWSSLQISKKLDFLNLTREKGVQSLRDKKYVELGPRLDKWEGGSKVKRGKGSVARWRGPKEGVGKRKNVGPWEDPKLPRVAKQKTCIPNKEGGKNVRGGQNFNKEV